MATSTLVLPVADSRCHRLNVDVGAPGAVAAVAGRTSLYVYRSVATGGAVVPASNANLLSVGLPAHEEKRMAVVATAPNSRRRPACSQRGYMGPTGWWCPSCPSPSMVAEGGQRSSARSLMSTPQTSEVSSSLSSSRHAVA